MSIKQTPVRHVELICSSSGTHVTQLFAGFGMLARRGAIEVRLRTATEYDPGPAGSILRALVDGERVVYDTRDHETFPSADLEWATRYFKRSLEPERQSASGRGDIISPLGLNYPVYAPGDWWLRRCGWTLARTRRTNLRSAITQACRLTPLVSALAEPGRTNSMYREFEQSPDEDGHAVLLMTRTWDPRRASGERADMRSAMNRIRTDSIRLLRSELGPLFVGGLAPNEDAIRDYPDLVLDRREVRKMNHLQLAKSSAVCITSRGLLNTNGWRLAEYVAASRPIVSERLQHTVPGSFVDGINYLSYSDPETLLSQVHRLLEDSEFRHRMRIANRQYYNEHVRPDSLVARTLEAIR